MKEVQRSTCVFDDIACLSIGARGFGRVELVSSGDDVGLDPVHPNEIKGSTGVSCSIYLWLYLALWIDISRSLTIFHLSQLEKIPPAHNHNICCAQQ